MAYRLNLGEPVARCVKRIAREEIGAAIDRLRGKSGAGQDKAVHEARKSIKRTRALLRLVRADDGEVYDTEGTRLRDVGRKLSRLRDAAALIAAFDGLRERYRAKLRRRSLDSIRRALMAHKTRVEKEMGIGATMRRL